jgi:uncharacterized protein
LNDLLSKIERDAENGDLNKWDLHLNRIYSNIIFKNKAEVVKDKQGKIIEINFCKDDMEEFSFFNNKIENLKSQMNQISDADNFDDKKKLKLRNELWSIINKKDTWIKKKMSDKGLYLQQIEHDPSRAIFGG